MSSRRAIFIAHAKRIAVGGLVPPGSIDGTGATNVSSSLQTWINAQPNGSTLNFTGKTYRIDQTITLSGRSNLTLLNGYFFTNTPTPDYSPIDTTVPYDSNARTRVHLRIDASSGIICRGMTIRGAHPNGGFSGDYVAALEAQHGIEVINSSTNIEIDDCTITDVYGDYVYVSGTSTTGITIHRCEMTRNGRQGIAITAGVNVLVQDNDIYNNRRACFDLEPNLSTVASGIVIDGNRIGATRLNFVASHGGGRIDNVTISNNILTGKTLAIDVSAEGAGNTRYNWVVDNNVSDTADSSGAGYLAVFHLCRHLTVTNNTQPISAFGWPYFNSCDDVTFQGNTMHGAAFLYQDTTSTRLKVCGNRLNSAAAFDNPAVCVANYGTPKQYSGLTGWFDAFQDQDVYAAAAAVSSITDYSGNGRHLVSTGAARPTMVYNVAGKQIRGYQFDGTSQFAGGTLAASQFITASAYTIFLVFEPTTIGAAAANDAVWSESVGTAGLYMRSTPDVYAYNVDSGGGDLVAQALTLGKRTLITMRHESGTLYISKDGGTETSIASGNTTNLTGLVRIAANYLATEFSNLLLHEIEFYNVALTAPQIADRNSRLMTDWRTALVYGLADTFSGTAGTSILADANGKLYAKPTQTIWQYTATGKAKMTQAYSGGGVNYLVADAGVYDGTVSVDIDAALGGSLCFRWGSNVNYNMLIAGGGDGSLSLWTNIGDSFTQVHPTATGLATTGIRQLKVVMSGATVESYYDGALVWADYNFTNQRFATYHGIFQFATVAPACEWDNLLMTPGAPPPPEVPTTYASDTFNRANAATLGNSDGPGTLPWSVVDGPFSIFSNLAFYTASNHNLGQATLPIGHLEVTVSADVTLSSTTDRAWCGFILRRTDNNNQLRVALSKSTSGGNQIDVIQRLAGSQSTLYTVSSAGLVNGQTYAVEVVVTEASTIAVWVDGVERIPATAFDSSLTGGGYGLMEYKEDGFDNGNSYWNNFLVTNNA